MHDRHKGDYVNMQKLSTLPNLSQRHADLPYVQHLNLITTFKPYKNETMLRYHMQHVSQKGHHPRRHTSKRAVHQVSHSTYPSWSEIRRLRLVAHSSSVDWLIQLLIHLGQRSFQEQVAKSHGSHLLSSRACSCPPCRQSFPDQIFPCPSNFLQHMALNIEKYEIAPISKHKWASGSTFCKDMILILNTQSGCPGARILT